MSAPEPPAPRRARPSAQHARNPARSVQIGGNHTVFAPAYGPPFVSDLDGGRRYGTLEDFRNFERRRERDLLQRANRRWKSLLEAYQPPPLEPARNKALCE